MGDTSADVLDCLKTGEYVSGAAIAKALGISRTAVNKHIQNLRDLGWRIESVPRRGTMLVDPKPADAPATPPASAPVVPPPEQPANVEAASAPQTPSGPPPFAGGWSSGNGYVRVDLYEDPELRTIAEIVRRIELLAGDERRSRVAAYVASRFL